MAKYNKSELYFFKFPNNFFESDEIEDLLSDYDGDSIIVFYLKLILLSVNKMGYLCKIISGELIPYNTNELCKKTNVLEDDFKRWTKRLFDVGLIEKRDNMLFIEDALKYTNQTVSAFKKQLQRKDEEICPPICPPEIDIINKNLDTINKNLDNRYENQDNNNCNSFSFEQLQQEGEYTYPALQDISYQVVSYLNKKAFKHFQPNAKKTIGLIKRRINEGFTLQDFYTVIDKMVNCWLGNEKLEEYLRPITLFSDKMDDYLNGDWERIETDWESRYYQ